MGDRTANSEMMGPIRKLNFWLPESDYQLLLTLITQGITSSLNVSEFIRQAVHHELTDELKRDEIRTLIMS